MSTSHRGEVSIEFLVFVGIILIFFIFFFGIIGVKTKEINDSTVFNDAQKISDRVADEINIAARFEGYYREFYLPKKLVNGDDYSIIIHKDIRRVEVKWNDYSAMSTLVTEQISGDIEPEYNRIRNENGVIIIES